MNIRSLRYVLGLMVMITAGAAFAAEDIVIENFERWGDDAEWTVEGEAFGDIADRK